MSHLFLWFVLFGHSDTAMGVDVGAAVQEVADALMALPVWQQAVLAVLYVC